MVDTSSSLWLRAQAVGWRGLMGVGMYLHRLASPRPPNYTFRRSIPSHFSSVAGNFLLYFYCPTSWRRRGQGQKYPLVVNFHGGGFTIGNACDDARWCDAVVSQVGAIVVSVDYRLAPEQPFPTAVKDGVEAILYLSEHAEELGLDMNNFAVSGFSAGGNMAFSVPLRLHAEILASQKGRDADTNSVYSGREVPGEVAAGTLKAIVAWYPSVDFTRPRPEREAIPTRPDLMLPKFFTDLFDASYLQPPTLDYSSPYLSPGVAPPELLRELPDMIMMYPCEFDGLKVEAAAFRKRLEEEIGKTVRWREVEGVPHGWDKSPNPFRIPVKVDKYYKDACETLRIAFGMEPAWDGTEADVSVGVGMEQEQPDSFKRYEVDVMGFNEDKARHDIHQQTEITTRSEDLE
ncbi:Alpha/Beta hydrolase protein [Rhexocercosporidium sp. MPI-PUGE-AT-0058]|nr:Alpha/Beta hydrolase protein [Rhexocercosporidium sp. MPI-PUGE-AT-0058]